MLRLRSLLLRFLKLQVLLSLMLVLLIIFTVSSSQTSSGTCPLVITRTYVITDACGNSATVTHTINVDDNTAPVITGTMAPINIEGCSFC